MLLSETHKSRIDLLLNTQRINIQILESNTIVWNAWNYVQYYEYLDLNDATYAKIL